MARRDRQPADINLLPIMNLFVVLIPFLLMGISFLQVGALGASTPVMNAGGGGESKKPTVVTIQLTEADWQVQVEPGDDTDAAGETLSWTLARAGDDSAKDALLPLMQTEVKDRFPQAQSLVLIPEPTLAYARVVEVMSAVRPIFPQMTVTTVAR